MSDEQSQFCELMDLLIKDCLRGQYIYSGRTVEDIIDLWPSVRDDIIRAFRALADWDELICDTVATLVERSQKPHGPADAPSQQ